MSLSANGEGWCSGRSRAEPQSFEEPTSRLVLLAKMDDATAASALAGFPAKQNPINAPLRKSFTYDQGRVTSRHVDLAAQTPVKVYFCDRHSQEELDGIADVLNIRSRTTHDGHTQNKMFAQTSASSRKRSTSVY